MGGFKEESGLGRVKSGLQLLTAFAFFDVKESVEGKRVRWKSGSDERGGDGGGAREDGELDVLIAAGFEKAVPGIGEAGSAGVRDNGDFFAALYAGDEFGDAMLLVVIVERNEWSGNLKMVEKAQRVAGVLASDEIGFAQGLDGPQGDVAEIPDWSGDEDDMWRVFRIHRRCERQSIERRGGGRREEHWPWQFAGCRRRRDGCARYWNPLRAVSRDVLGRRVAS